MGVVVALIGLYRPPVAVLGPAPAVDLSGDVTIQGVPTGKLHGRFLLVAVSVGQPTAVGALLALVDPRRELVPISALVPKGVSERQFERLQRRLFSESQKAAAAAAAQAAGLPVKITGTGARVAQVLPTAPAAKLLRPGDVIVSIDSNEILLASDLRKFISERTPGSKISVGLIRGKKKMHLSIKSIRLPSGAETTAGIGVLAQTKDLLVDLPFKVRFKPHNKIGGPSAGLAYALTIADMLDPADIAAGRTIAASGTIELNGEVGEVGGLTEKAVGAERSGARLLLVPQTEVKQVKQTKLRIKGVHDLTEAIKLLAS